MVIKSRKFEKEKLFGVSDAFNRHTLHSGAYRSSDDFFSAHLVDMTYSRPPAVVWLPLIDREPTLVCCLCETSHTRGKQSTWTLSSTAGTRSGNTKTLPNLSCVCSISGYHGVRTSTTWRTSSGTTDGVINGIQQPSGQSLLRFR